MIDLKDKQFSREELMALIPQRAYEIIGKSTPEELQSNVKFNLNIDEQYKNDMIFAFSYYQALNERQRSGIKHGLANLSINYLLTWIGQNNETLLDEIESMYDKDIPVVAWLEVQLVRVKAMALSFDERIAEEERNDRNSTNPK